MNWEQLKTIFWLRSRLMRNQWARSHGWGAVIAIIVGVGAILMGGTMFGTALAAGAFAMRDAEPSVVMGAWFGLTAVFLFFWTLGLITELQRSETIDLTKLLHLPAALGQLFVVNYIVSHFSLSLVAMVPAMLGLAIGLVISKGPQMALMIPLALSMILMVTAWTYYLRGWLATLMSNPRRRRTVIMIISLVFVALAQGPNLYFNVIARHAGHHHPGVTFNAGSHQTMDTLVMVQRYIPPLWVSLGARGLAENRILPAIYGTLGCLCLAALGLWQAYRRSIKFYRGDVGGKTARPSPAAAPIRRDPAKQPGRLFLEWQLPGVPEESAALALATFRSLVRAPEVKIALVSQVIAIVVVVGMIFFGTPPHLAEDIKPFIATGVAAFSTFMLVQFFANMFGFDRDGFRSLILSPADRRLVLLGKNLAILPLGIGLGGMLLLMVSLWLHLPPLAVLAAAIQLMTLLLISCIGGNVLSILVPFRIQPGAMRPTKMPVLPMIVMVLCQFLMPVIMSPVFLAPLADLLWRKAGLPEFVPVNLIFSVLLCGVVMLVYHQVLPPLGRLLQRRETRILGVVTVEVE